MTKLITTVLTWILGMSAPAAMAACGTTACDNANLKMIYVQANGNVFIEIHEESSSLNCTRAENRFLTLHASDANADMIYSMLLSAQAAGKPIGRLRISEGSSDCAISYVYQLS